MSPSEFQSDNVKEKRCAVLFERTGNEFKTIRERIDEMEKKVESQVTKNEFRLWVGVGLIMFAFSNPKVAMLAGKLFKLF